MPEWMWARRLQYSPNNGAMTRIYIMYNQMIIKRILTLILAVVITNVLAGQERLSEKVVKLTNDAILGGSEVVEGGHHISGGQPDQVVLDLLKETGYRAVVDMRRLSEDRGFDEQAAVENLGMDYYSLPVDGLQGVTFDNARRLDQLLNDIDGPVLLHCKSGNRVGALLALRASLNGASDEDALFIGKVGGMTSYEKTVRERLAE